MNISLYLKKCINPTNIALLLIILGFLTSHLSAQASSNIPLSDFNQFIVAPLGAVEDDDNMAGVIFFKNDFNENTEIMCQTKKKMKHTLMMTDQENGNIYRIEQARFPSFENSHTSDYEQQMNDAAIKLKKLCLDIDLAPVVEPGYDGKRTSHDRMDAMHQAQEMANVLREQQIIPTWKHFPGINFNQQAIDKHNEFAKYYSFIQAEANLALMTQDEILSYVKEFQSNNADLLMVSNNIYPQVDNQPAILSSWFIEKAHAMQPDSLLITDDVSELKLTDEMILTLFKNSDFLLVTSEKDKKRIVRTLEKAYQNHQISSSLLTEKINRIQQWKNHNHLPE
jgi:beta-glucosidase-like glycosyl hydrolase